MSAQRRAWAADLDPRPNAQERHPRALSWPSAGSRLLGTSPEKKRRQEPSPCQRAPSRTLREALKLAMVPRYLLMAGVMLYLLPACTQEWSQALQKRDKREIAMLLSQLQNTPSYSCLNDRENFQFPWKRGNSTPIQKAQGTCLYQLMLQQIFMLFSTEHGFASWKHSVLEKLLSSLHHSLEHLERKEEGSPACLSLGNVVRKYFRKIKLYLNQKKHSVCAWEIVRGEIQASFALMKQSSKRI
ncbi:interferon alpha-21-like [Sorex fumeus]|uniref:interferon alpha-21-like n=1 Tax=Sorex fumeus TaxID=62283 RepID=UPI0024AE0F92|nr:interferon alpha-21-like [Sorex fumeus]